jgi:HKD family nuclease
MPTLDFLLQGMQPRNHKSVLHDLLAIDSPEEILISVAFLRENGIELIKNQLALIAPEKIKFYVGIRNDITSMQGIYSIFKAGYSVFTVDTGTSDFIYHPKIYLSHNREYAKVALGSANLTLSGLTKNVEASVLIDLDKSDTRDQEFLSKIITSLNTLPNRFPRNVTEITSLRQIVSLKNNGRLVDERIVTRNFSIGINLSTNGNRGGRESIPRMDLTIENTPNTRTRRNNRNPVRRITEMAQTPVIMSTEWTLVWISAPLTARDLNIPRGATTHATGSMGMKKGEMDGIDHKRYFRQDVFNELTWVSSPTTSNPHREIANAEIYLTIKGINYPKHYLELTHDPRTNTRTYEQSNFVTGLRWGTAKSLIAQEDLLNSKISLYKRSIGNQVEYLMEFN